MRIHYWSASSGNTEALMNKLSTPTYRMSDEPLDDYTIAAVPTYEQVRTGDYIPRPVRSWLGRNGQWVIGVIGTGNRNFGADYCRAAHDISDCLQVPVLYRCELMGTPTDVDAIDTGIRQHWDELVRLRHPAPTT